LKEIRITKFDNGTHVVYVVEVVEVNPLTYKPIRYEKLYDGADGNAAFMAADAAQKREFGLES
jgi:hypothetical protein